LRHFTGKRYLRTVWTPTTIRAFNIRLIKCNLQINRRQGASPSRVGAAELLAQRFNPQGNFIRENGYTSWGDYYLMEALDRELNGNEMFW